MAQLVTTKEKYGISVATRLDPNLAHHIASKADRLGITMSKMVGMIITEAINSGSNSENHYQDQVVELQHQVEYLKNIYRNAMSQFIDQVAVDDEELLDFIQQYNEILETLKEENDDE